ncbi:MAG: FHA domain-containing protein [Planctomycetia bacterium]|nr:FHA domain-containing protein [Planctomycetia bacterium]
MGIPTSLTLRIIDGPDRGRVFRSAPLPISIGREPTNTVALRDEHLSRYHCRICRLDDKLILCDIQSTNGTRLNGEDIRTVLLKIGDVISVGKTLIIVGTREEICDRLESEEALDFSNAAMRFLSVGNSIETLPEGLIREISAQQGNPEDILHRLHALRQPALPEGLTMMQKTALTEIFMYFRLRMRLLVQAMKINDLTQEASCKEGDWQAFLDLFSRISDYENKIGEPQ